MGLRTIAEKDLGRILEDSVYGFGWDIVVISPDNTPVDMVGFTNDISQVIDPDTGAAITGRSVTTTLRMQTLIDSGLGIPKNIPDVKLRPWVVIFKDINGIVNAFKVSEANPDRTLGLVVCFLEFYKKIEFLEWTKGDFVEWVKGEFIQIPPSPIIELPVEPII